MCKKILALSVCLWLISGAPGQATEVEDYKGTFSTQALYDLCSRNDSVSKDKCAIYIQGLMYGLIVGRNSQTNSMPICLPKMDVETARDRILKFIDGVTEGHPSNNKDGGDWMAFMAVAAGNLCKN
jgi:hypothetical protein